MNILTYRFTLDTQKNGVQRVLQGFQTGEFTARMMEITLKEGSENYVLPLSNISAVMYVKRPSDETPSINPCAIDYENNKIIYNVADQDIAEAGIVELQLKVINTVLGNTIALVSPKFGMEVWESNVDDSEAEESPVYTALTEALADAIAMKDSAIADLYIDENNIFTVVFGNGTTYTSTVIADAVARIGDVEINALKAEGYAVGKQNGVDVTSESIYFNNNAKHYSDEASTSATNAATSETNAGLSETNASGYATTAEGYKDTTKGYMDTTQGYMNTTEGYKDLAYGYKGDAATSATNAGTSETNALAYKNAAAGSASDALGYKNDAKDYKDAAATSAGNAYTSEVNAGTHETNASGYATTAGQKAILAESYAVGGTGTRTGEDNDNAKHYKEQCEQIAAGMAGGIIPMGTVTFANLPTQNLASGWMYNISDDFTSDSRFKDGGGKSYPAGTNVYVTADLMWDCYAGALVNVNGHTGQTITLDGSDLKVTGYSKASSVADVSPTDSINVAIGKVEKKIDSAVTGVSSFNSRTGAITPAAHDYDADQVDFDPTSTTYTDASNLQEAIEDLDGAIGSANTAIGNANSAIADINDINTYNIASTDWVANTDSSTNTAYPYIAEITASDYAATDTPTWEVFGANGIPTATERECIDMIQYADFGASSGTKIILYANDQPTVALVLKAKGH